jgi:1-acyl-sn-glycerol-3-phosphate acyltransferase
MTRIVSAAKLAFFVCFTLPLMPVQLVLVLLRLPASRWLPVYVHRVYCWILGLHVEVHGRPVDRRPVLFVSNHTSWIDIVVLSAVVPVSFIAKHEVAGWPFFGWLAKLQRTVFVERRLARTVAHRDEIQARLAAGDNLVLFAEGTSNDGNRVLPFKTAFFAVAERAAPGSLTIQPVSVAYTRLDGIPMGRRLRHLFAWYGDMELAPHLWQVLGCGKGTVEVRFHPAVPAVEMANRKALAVYCFEQVRTGVVESLTGRPLQPGRPPVVTTGEAA